MLSSPAVIPQSPPSPGPSGAPARASFSAPLLALLISACAGTANFAPRPPRLDADARPVIRAGKVFALRLCVDERHIETLEGRVTERVTTRRLCALDPSTSRAIWTLEPEALAMPPARAFEDASVYVACRDGFIRAVDLASGSERWSAPHGGEGATQPCVANGVVAVQDPKVRLVLLDAPSGRTLRVIATGSHANAPGAPSILGDRVIARTCLNQISNAYHRYYGELRAFGLGGEPLWTFRPEGEDNWRHSPPVLVNGSLCFGSGYKGGRFIALDSATGANHWETALPGDASADEPILNNSTVYVGAAGGHVIALDAATGLVHWSASLAGEYPEGEAPSLALAGRRLAAVWRRGEGPRLQSSLVTLDAATGRALRREEFPGAALSPPAFANGRLYFVDSTLRSPPFAD